MPGTVMNGTCGNWDPVALIAMWPWAGRDAPPLGAQTAHARGWDPYAQLKWLVEAHIGWIKRILGFHQFGMRGLRPVQGEWFLACLALNVKCLHRLLRP